MFTVFIEKTDGTPYATNFPLSFFDVDGGEKVGTTDPSYASGVGGAKEVGSDTNGDGKLDTWTYDGKAGGELFSQVQFMFHNASNASVIAQPGREGRTLLFTMKYEINLPLCPTQATSIKYTCTNEACLWIDYTRGVDFDFYTEFDPVDPSHAKIGVDWNCDNCKARCTADPNCGGIRCSLSKKSYCSWWAVGTCRVGSWKDTTYTHPSMATCRNNRQATTTKTIATTKTTPTEALGNDVRKRPNIDDAAHYIQFVDTSRCFTVSGQATGVRVFVGHISQSGQKMQIYRPQGGNSYKLIAETPVLEYASLGASHKTFRAPLEFQAGDCIGWAHTGRGTIPYSLGSNAVRFNTRLDSSTAEVGSVTDFNEEQVRVYSYTVEYTEKASL